MGDDMTYCIELNITPIVFLVFILGFWLGCLFIRYLNKPKKTIDYYDGTHGMGYQPKTPMPPLKKPKKGGPPLPPHNPHK